MESKVNLEVDCPDLSKSVISTILQNPRYSQTFLRDMQEERRKVEKNQQTILNEMQQQFQDLPLEIIEATLKENGYNAEKALGPLLEKMEEFRKFQDNQRISMSTINNGNSNIKVELNITSSSHVDLSEPIHITWKMENLVPTKYDWIGLFPKSANNKQYFSYQWTGTLKSGKMTFLAPNAVGDYEFRFFHGANYYQHLAISSVVSVGPVFELVATREEKEIVVQVIQRSGIVYSWAWVGLFAKGAEHKNYKEYQYLKNQTELHFAIPAKTKEEVEEYEARIFTSSYTHVGSSNLIAI